MQTTMNNNDSNFRMNEAKTSENFPSQSHSGRNAAVGVLAAGLVIALAGNGYLLVRSNHLNEDLAKNESTTQAQIAKLSDSNNMLREQDKQRLDTMQEQVKKDVQSANAYAAVAVKRARGDAQKQVEDLNHKLAEQTEQQQQIVNNQFDQMKNVTDSKFTEVSGNVNTVKTNVEEVKANVAATQAELTKTSLDLKRAMGDMGVMSGLIATNSKDLDSLRALGERNYMEFDIAKNQGSRKLGDVTLALKKSDTKRNRFTMEVVADDKRVEKKDKTINEPVQFYMNGNMQPYEIVVNQVTKDRVIGYLSTPKVKLARR